MLVRAMVCASLALALLATPRSLASSTVAHYPQVHKVQCATGSGSAVLTDRGWISVAHVTNIGGCEIDGHPIIASPENPLDFSTLKVSLSGKGIPVNCDGFKAMHWYWAVGYAGGFEWQTMTRHLATFKDSDDGLRILLGRPTVIPGMSGGLVMNAEGEAVGVVNAYNSFFGASYSRALADTSICKKD